MDMDSAPRTLRLADYIRQDMDAVIAEWVSFARTHIPSGKNMTHLALQNHIVRILDFIADDLESSQTPEEQFSKSQGDGPSKHPLHESVAEIHAALRLKSGFNVDQMISEYRALRASIVKLWVAKKQGMAETDINDLTRFHEAIDQSIAESVAEYTHLIDRSKNLFLGIIAHDLRNPIGAASMAGEALQRMLPADSKQMAYASQIVSSTRRGVQILDDLLDITRSSFGTEIPVTKAKMDMGELGVQLVEEMQTLANGRTIEIKIDGDTRGAWDKARMGQVFSNLIGNAVQYSAPSSTVLVTVRGSAREVTISVHNHGSPIPPDKLDTIFEALMRGQPSQADEQSTGHLGLGLYITKKIVTAHDGNVEVASNASGTTFTVRLPRNS